MTRQCNIWNIHKFSYWQHLKFVANPGDDPNYVEHGSKFPCGGLGDLRELHNWEVNPTCTVHSSRKDSKEHGIFHEARWHYMFFVICACSLRLVG